MMKAIVSNGVNFIAKEIPVPELRPFDILVRNKAVALNPVDFKVRQGLAAKKEEKVLGYDAAGVVEALGEKQSRFKVGDEVMFSGDVGRNGTNADCTAVDSRVCAIKPKNLDWAESASLPLVSITAWEGFFDCLGLEENQPNLKVLIINGAGGVGSIAIQIAKQVLNAHVIATASRPETIEFCTNMGADAVINHRKNLKEELAAKGVDSVDVVFCCVDLDLHYDGILEVISPCGKIVAITIGDSSKVDVSKMFYPKRVTLAFEFMFARPMFELEPERQGALLERIAKLVEEGKIKTTVTKKFDELTVSSLTEAHAIQESGKSFGKIVISKPNN